MTARTKAGLVLSLGVFVVSWAAVLIRWAGGAPALVIAAGRLTLASLVLTPIAFFRGVHRELAILRRRDLLLALLSGLALAAHFASWISSLSLTTVASSVALVSTNPLWVGLAGHFWLRERLSRSTSLAILLAMVGSALIGYGDLALSREALWGDLLALIGAMTGSVYFLLGRDLRQRLSILAYIWPVYATAALALLLVCLLTGRPLLGYMPGTYGFLLLLAIGPQLLGHSSLNYALEHLSAVFVTIAILGEPIGSALLALLLLGEVPPWTSLVGGGLVLTGITLAGRAEWRR